MRQLAPQFGVSPATVCRVVQGLRPLLALGPVSRRVNAADRLWIVDSTLVPARDRKVGASSRNYRFSADVQVIIDADPPGRGHPSDVATGAGIGVASARLTSTPRRHWLLS